MERWAIFLVLLLATTMTVGCASQQSTAPFHVYHSPLLAGETQTVEPRARSFDPLELGDHPAPDTAYADASDGARAPAAQAPVEDDDTKRRRKEAPKYPPLTTIGGGVGGKKTAQKSSSDSSPEQTTRAAEFVHAIYRLNGVELPGETRGDVAALYRHCKKSGEVSQSGTPLVGDIVFFHNTYDRSGDGRNNDWYTEVAMVDDVGDDGTIELIGYRDGEVRTFHLNLRHPDETEVDGAPANSKLRKPAPDDAPFTQYYAGQLFAGYCTLLGAKSEFVVVDNWQPGMKLPDRVPGR